MLIGYARLSTDEKDLTAQPDARSRVGVLQAELVEAAHARAGQVRQAPLRSSAPSRSRYVEDIEQADDLLEFAADVQHDATLV